MWLGFGLTRERRFFWRVLVKERVFICLGGNIHKGDLRGFLKTGPFRVLFTMSLRGETNARV